MVGEKWRQFARHRQGEARENGGNLRHVAVAQCVLSTGLMSQPREIVRGRIYLVTRRTVMGFFLLRPCPQVKQFFLYTLALYARRYGIKIHAFVVMFNHIHIVLTDTRGCLPNFLRDFDRVMALGIKKFYQWRGEVWDGQQPSCVALMTPMAVVEKLAYTMANPVQAGLVSKAEQWPGLIVLPAALGIESWDVERPNMYFDPTNPQWPAQERLELTMPQHYLTDEELRAKVAQELERLEQAAHERFKGAGQPIAKPRGLRVTHKQRARSAERRGNPTFAVGKGQTEAYRQVSAGVKRFRSKYREALRRWQEGERQVRFPAHTWQMSWLHRVQVEPG